MRADLAPLSVSIGWRGPPAQDGQVGSSAQLPGGDEADWLVRLLDNGDATVRADLRGDLGRVHARADDDGGDASSRQSAEFLRVGNSSLGRSWFVVQGEQSRDKFMSSGQDVAVKGATVGYYLFRRAEENRTDSPIA